MPEKRFLTIPEVAEEGGIGLSIVLALVSSDPTVVLLEGPRSPGHSALDAWTRSQHDDR